MNITLSPNLSKEYLEHSVFRQLAEYADFYLHLSGHISGWITLGTNSIINLDTWVFSSIQGTLESIHDILLKGRINDSYALLRKYYDSTIINVYSNLYLTDNFNIDNLVVLQIENWRRGKEKLPEYRTMSGYIKKSVLLAPITNLLNKDNTYKDIRNRCNNHIHYNYYSNLLFNDNFISLPNKREIMLDTFLMDLNNIFIQHFSYLFYLNEHYMTSTHYIDSLDVGLEPEEGSQYYVAEFIQKIFDAIIKAKRMDLAIALKNKTSMALN